jgi:hypothetical protein
MPDRRGIREAFSSPLNWPMVEIAGQKPKIEKRHLAADGPKHFPSGVAINFVWSSRLADKKVILTWACH